MQESSPPQEVSGGTLYCGRCEMNDALMMMIGVVEYYVPGIVPGNDCDFAFAVSVCWVRFAGLDSSDGGE